MEKHKFYMAPLRGITDRIFRFVYERHFGRFDCLLAPFVPTVRGARVRDHHIADLLPGGGNDPARLVPQIIGHDVEGFLLLCNRFAELGFSSVNWNLGCPAPLITKKMRGSGLLPHRDTVEKFLDGAVPKLPLPLSIKTRLGLDSKDELENLIPVFNSYPLKELIVHPRTGSQLYGGTVDIDKFEICQQMSKHPVVYNGDIQSANDLNFLSSKFSKIKRWMIGRGIVRRPWLLRECTGAPIPEDGDESILLIKKFLDDLLQACNGHPHPTKVLGRMKEIWRYLGDGLDASGALTKRIIRCGDLREYVGIVESLKSKDFDFDFNPSASTLSKPCSSTAPRATGKTSRSP